MKTSFDKIAEALLSGCTDGFTIWPDLKGGWQISSRDSVTGGWDTNIDLIELPQPDIDPEQPKKTIITTYREKRSRHDDLI